MQKVINDKFFTQSDRLWLQQTNNNNIRTVKQLTIWVDPLHTHIWLSLEHMLSFKNAHKNAIEVMHSYCCAFSVLVYSSLAKRHICICMRVWHCCLMSSRDVVCLSVALFLIRLIQIYQMKLHFIYKKRTSMENIKGEREFTHRKTDASLLITPPAKMGKIIVSRVEWLSRQRVVNINWGSM